MGSPIGGLTISRNPVDVYRYLHRFDPNVGTHGGMVERGEPDLAPTNNAMEQSQMRAQDMIKAFQGFDPGATVREGEMRPGLGALSQYIRDYEGIAQDPRQIMLQAAQNARKRMLLGSGITLKEAQRLYGRPHEVPGIGTIEIDDGDLEMLAQHEIEMQQPGVYQTMPGYGFYGGDVAAERGAR